MHTHGQESKHPMCGPTPTASKVAKDAQKLFCPRTPFSSFDGSVVVYISEKTFFVD